MLIVLSNLLKMIDFQKLCVVCGYRGPFACSKCKQTYYCSKEHQVLHWKSGHKQKCQTEVEDICTTGVIKVIFNTYFIY